MKNPMHSTDLADGTEPSRLVRGIVCVLVWSAVLGVRLLIDKVRLPDPASVDAYPPTLLVLYAGLMAMRYVVLPGILGPATWLLFLPRKRSAPRWRVVAFLVLAASVIGYCYLSDLLTYGGYFAEHNQIGRCLLLGLPSAVLGLAWLRVRSGKTLGHVR